MGKKIIIVDDEAIVAIDMEISLTREGYEVVGVAGTVKDALALIAAQGFDMAILDANLHGASAAPLAEALRAQGRPFVWVTGYSTEQMGERQGDAPIVTKPFALAQLIAKLRSLEAPPPAG